MKTSVKIAAALLLIVLLFSAYMLIDAQTVKSINGFSLFCTLTLEHGSSEIEETERIVDVVQEGADESEELLRIQKRILKAVLAPAILAQLAERRFLSAANIMDVLQKSSNIRLSSGTVYPVLDALEKEGKIKRLPRRINRLYVLTSKGQETVENMQLNAGELLMMISELIK
jgi:DNA-binding PadR family transcriptional regulator